VLTLCLALLIALDAVSLLVLVALLALWWGR
jgi:hypothetical protein